MFDPHQQTSANHLYLLSAHSHGPPQPSCADLPCYFCLSLYLECPSAFYLFRVLLHSLQSHFKWHLICEAISDFPDALGAQ